MPFCPKLFTWCERAGDGPLLFLLKMVCASQVRYIIEKLSRRATSLL